MATQEATGTTATNKATSTNSGAGAGAGAGTGATALLMEWLGLLDRQGVSTRNRDAHRMGVERMAEYMLPRSIDEATATELRGFIAYLGELGVSDQSRGVYRQILEKWVAFANERRRTEVAAAAAAALSGVEPFELPAAADREQQAVGVSAPTAPTAPTVTTATATAMPVMPVMPETDPPKFDSPVMAEAMPCEDGVTEGQAESTWPFANRAATAAPPLDGIAASFDGASISHPPLAPMTIDFTPVEPSWEEVSDQASDIPQSAADAAAATATAAPESVLRPLGAMPGTMDMPGATGMGMGMGMPMAEPMAEPMDRGMSMPGPMAGWMTEQPEMASSEPQLDPASSGDAEATCVFVLPGPIPASVPATAFEPAPEPPGSLFAPAPALASAWTSTSDDSAFGMGGFSFDAPSSESSSAFTMAESATSSLDMNMLGPSSNENAFGVHVQAPARAPVQDHGDAHGADETETPVRGIPAVPDFGATQQHHQQHGHGHGHGHSPAPAREAPLRDAAGDHLMGASVPSIALGGSPKAKREAAAAAKREAALESVALKGKVQAWGLRMNGTERNDLDLAQIRNMVTTGALTASAVIRRPGGEWMRAGDYQPLRAVFQQARFETTGGGSREALAPRDPLAHPVAMAWLGAAIGALVGAACWWLTAVIAGAEVLPMAVLVGALAGGGAAWLGRGESLTPVGAGAVATVAAMLLGRVAVFQTMKSGIIGETTAEPLDPLVFLAMSATASSLIWWGIAVLVAAGLGALGLLLRKR